jgi:hypothetical protein
MSLLEIKREIYVFLLHIYIHTYINIHAYHSRFIPVGVTKPCSILVHASYLVVSLKL